jgi:chemotaxis regulatin CheY-phosphate phosphatase CheZ
MDADAVSTRIEQLVDLLRANQESEIKLSDVAGVTEVLLATMRRYFNGIDMSIYGELRQLSEHIQKARTEIAELRPTDLKEDKIPRAGKELEAIVQATEEATGTIMDAAEEIMSSDNEDADAYKQTVDDACMRIFEACSFQDITGQRITKVVTTLTHIEERLTSLQAAWGPDIQEAIERARSEDDRDEEADLLNGPALEGEGIDQSAVDSLLNGEEVSAETASDIEDETIDGDGPELHGQEAIDALFSEDAEPETVAPAADSAHAGKSEDDIAAASAESNDWSIDPGEDVSADDDDADDDDLAMIAGEEASQDEIDALFN